MSIFFPDDLKDQMQNTLVNADKTMAGLQQSNQKMKEVLDTVHGIALDIKAITSFVRGAVASRIGEAQK